MSAETASATGCGARRSSTAPESLITAGSIVAFTAYVWLLHYESPTKVGTYAYVNPIVAVILGAALGGEAVGKRTVLAAMLILASVAAITTAKGRKASSDRKREATPERTAAD